MQERASVYYQDVILPTIEVLREHQIKDKHLSDAKIQIIEKGEVSNIVWKGDRIRLPESLWSHVMREYHDNITQGQRLQFYL